VREAESALEQLKLLVVSGSGCTQASRVAAGTSDTRGTATPGFIFRASRVSREIKEQAEHQQTTARAAADQARLLAESLAVGGSEEDILTHRLAAARAALA